MKKKLLLCSLLPLVASTLTGCNQKETIVLCGTMEDERIAFIQDLVSKKFPEYNVVIQYMGTGAMVSKFKGEGKNTDIDIIYEIEANSVEIISQTHNDMFYEMNEFDFSKFNDSAISYGHKRYAPECFTYGAIAINKKVLSDRGIAIPTTYEDLLNPIYKDLIEMPNPKSSGTGYLFYNGVVSYLTQKYNGDKSRALSEAITYFEALNSNIKEFTSSGLTPIKSVDRGEVAIGFANLYQCVEFMRSNSDLDYTFLDYGAPSNLYVSTIIKGKETRKSVMDVWTYIFDEVNQKQVEKFIPDPLYKNMTPEDPNYPTEINAITMQGLFDPVYKNELLDAWTL